MLASRLNILTSRLNPITDRLNMLTNRIYTTPKKESTKRGSELLDFLSLVLMTTLIFQFEDGR